MEKEIREQGELCMKCNKRYSTVWKTPDGLWEKVVGFTNESGLMCPNCFDKLAKSRGIYLYWECSEKDYPTNQDQETKKEILEKVKNPLKIVLDFVERWNKQDKEKEVAEAAAKLEDFKG